MIPLTFAPIYSQLNLSARHRFPIQKYQGIYDALRRQGVPHNAFEHPEPVTEDTLCQYYDVGYVQALTQGKLEAKAMRRIGFEWSPQLIKRSLTAIGGTCLTAHNALRDGIALNLTGGYHHAFASYGSGFCLFNDLYLAAKSIQQQPGIDNVLIIDCDVHQGDGTAHLAENDKSVYTVSLHGEKNFPQRKQHSNLDMGLPKHCNDAEYLDALDTTLHLIERFYQPDAVIYDAGVDIHVDDDLGLLDISTVGVRQRDTMVLNWCKKHSLPVACVIGGGYQRNIEALVEVHMQLFHAAGVTKKGCY